MYRLLAPAFLLAALGCADEATSPQAAGEKSDETTSTADVRIDLSVPQSDAPLEYPEKADVVRLLVRASELESNGEFQDALAVTNQAVAIDSSSPRANEMKARLEELLRRIRISPRLDKRTRASKVAQRTMP